MADTNPKARPESPGAEPPGGRRRTRFLGLCRRREAWCLSLRGWLLLLSLVTTFILWIFLWSHGFLAMTERKDASVLIVEGWVPDYVLKLGYEEYAAHYYQHVITTGGMARGWAELEKDDTYARLAAARLLHFGVPREILEAVPAMQVQRDRTYASAMALREWIEAHGNRVTKINVLTLDVHARRTRMLFQKALGPGVEVGVLAIGNKEFDPAHWWAYSEGVKEMLSEGAAYLYARLLFQPIKEL